VEDNYTRHMFRFHKDRPDFRMDCGHSACSLTFSSYKSRMLHVSKFHKRNSGTSVFDAESHDMPQNISYENIEVNERVDESDHENAQDDNTAACNVQSNDGEITPYLPTTKEFAEAQFLLNLRAKKVTFPVVEAVMNHTEVVVQSCVEDFKGKILEHVRSNDGRIDELTLSRLSEESSKIFVNMRTKYMQDKYFESKMSMLQPQKIVLDKKVVRQGGTSDGVNRQCVVKDDTFHYVSLIDSLKNLYANESFVNMLQPMIGKDDGVLRDIFDGSLFKNNPILAEDPEAVAILGYTDGVNFVDTASSRPVKYTMFYYLVKEYRSSLFPINFLMAVESSLVKTYGINELLRPFAEDIKKLQKGVDLPSGKNVKGTLVGFSGDNLASNEVGGFKEGFTVGWNVKFFFEFRK